MSRKEARGSNGFAAFQAAVLLTTGRERATVVQQIACAIARHNNDAGQGTALMGHSTAWLSDNPAIVHLARCVICTSIVRQKVLVQPEMARRALSDALNGGVRSKNPSIRHEAFIAIRHILEFGNVRDQGLLCALYREIKAMDFSSEGIKKLETHIELDALSTALEAMRILQMTYASYLL